MFQVGNTQFTIKIYKKDETSSDKTINLDRDTFISLLIQEPVGVEGQPSNGLTLSLVELSFKSSDSQLVSELMTTKDQPVIIEIELLQPPVDKQEYFKFKKTNMDLTIDVDSVNTVKAYGVSYLDDFTEVPRIKAYGTDVDEPSADDISIKVIEQLESVKGKSVELDIKDEITTTDKQVWIQANLPDSLFVSELIKHSYIEGSFLLAAINYNKLRVIDIQKAYTEAKNNKATLTVIGNESDSSSSSTQRLVAEKINVETLSGVWDYTLSDNTQNPIFDVKNGTMRDSSMQVESSSFFASLFSKKTQDKTDRSKIVRSTPLRIDTGSTHEKYWEAYLGNQRGMYKLMQNLIYIETTSYVKTPIRPLDFVFLNLDVKKNNIVSAYTGIAIVLNQSRYFTHRGQHTQILLANSFGSINK